jgi:hypothetical protein
MVSIRQNKLVLFTLVLISICCLVKTNGQRSASRSRSREKIEPTNCTFISTRPSTKDCSSIEECIVFFSLYFILILK